MGPPNAQRLPPEPVPDWARALFPEEPLLFVRTPHPLVGDYVYQHVVRKLVVICSASVEKDGKRWMHVSCSRPSSLPTWEDLRLVKDTFIGRDKKAIQVLPPEAEYVNLHPNVLHLWSCLDGDGLPDFRKEGQV